MLFKKLLTHCTSFHSLTTRKLIDTQLRHASKASAGVARYGYESRPKFRGVKVHHGQIVKPGDIIVRQKGNKFWPGYNVGQSRDFTLYALKEGCVEIVKDPVYDRRYVMVAQRKNPPPVFGIPVKRMPNSHVHLIPKVKKFQVVYVQDPANLGPKGRFQTLKRMPVPAPPRRNLLQEYKFDLPPRQYELYDGIYLDTKNTVLEYKGAKRKRKKKRLHP